MGKKKSPVWKYFEDDTQNKKNAICNLCNASVSRGSAISKNKNTSSLLSHLKGFHVADYNKVQKENELREKFEKAMKAKEDEKLKTSMLRSKNDRKAALNVSLPDFIASNTKWSFNSEKAQRLHKAIFEELIIDLQPFTHVDGLGFLRTKQMTVPQFEVASSKYYRSLLEPTFEKVLAKLKAQLMEDNPVVIVLSLDGWSQFKHGYIGINIHYLKDWERKHFHMICIPFDERHTAENLRDSVKEHCENQNILDRISLILRDNAANVQAAFTSEFNLPSAGCLSHSLQLVINSELLNQALIKDLIKKVKEVVSHSSHSINFNNELRKQQKSQMEDQEVPLVLIMDVTTRWNSKFYMLKRFLFLKKALIPTIANCEGLDIEFNNNDWKNMEKVVKVLQPFEEATKLLSKSSASISQAIMIVTVIIKALSKTEDDWGVRTTKRAMIKALEQRFSSMEMENHYSIATFLDPRYKSYFFRDPETAVRVKEILSNKLEVELEELEDFHGMEDENPATVQNESKTETIAQLMNEIMEENIHEKSMKFEVAQFLETYENSKTEENAMEFWKIKASSMKKVDRAAAKLAEIYLTPPPTSVDVERLFSTGGDIITPERNRLSPETASKVLFLKENFPVVKFQY